MRNLLAPLLLLFVVACDRPGHADTVFEACMDNIVLQCECGDETGGEGWACGTTEEDREAACEEYRASSEDGIRATDAWLDWWNCYNATYVDTCDYKDADTVCGPAPRG